MGIMGAVSGAVLEEGGDVTGIVPYAMVAAGGEVDQTKGIHAPHVQLKEKGRERVRSLTVSIWDRLPYATLVVPSRRKL